MVERVGLLTCEFVYKRGGERGRGREVCLSKGVSMCGHVDSSASSSSQSN